MNRRGLATGTGIGLAAAVAGTALAIRARRRYQAATTDYEKQITALERHVTAVMNDPKRTAEAALINEILLNLGMTDMVAGLAIPRWQQFLLRLESLTQGQPSRKSLQLLVSFLHKIRPSTIPLAELALGVAISIGCSMVSGEAPPDDLVELIDEFDRRLRNELAEPPPAAHQVTLRAIIEKLTPGVIMVGGLSRGEWIRARLAELRMGALSPIHAGAFEATILDIAGEAGKFGAR